MVHGFAPTRPPEQGAIGSRTYSEIVDSGVFRVCYLPGNYPLSYFNSRGELVGFDVEMAHRFAERVNLSLEFMPLDGLREGPEKLRTGYCDAVFNSVAVELAWIEAAAATDAFSKVTVAFIVPDHRRGEFSTWGECMGDTLPVPEVCDGVVDDDCDGVVDNGCGCVEGVCAWYND